MEITTWSEQIIIGCLMGNGYISHNNIPYLGMSETHNQDWIYYKANLLKDMQSKTPFSKYGKSLKWRSVSNNLWDHYRNKFYKNNRKNAEMEVLNIMNARAMAIWFGDKGFWYSNKKIGLRTTAFGESNAVIETYFNEVGMPCKARKDTHGASRIVFERDGTYMMLKVVAKWLPEFMYHRLEFRS